MTSRETKNQKNITLTTKQVQFIKDSLGKMRNKDIFTYLKVSNNVFYQNLRLIFPKEKTELYFEY